MTWDEGAMIDQMFHAVNVSVRMSRRKKWEDECESSSDEPWYKSRKAAIPNLCGHAIFFEKNLKRSGLDFELFDLGHQLGVSYTNPDTKKRWAVRVKHDADADRLSAAAAELREKTA